MRLNRRTIIQLGVFVVVSAVAVAVMVFGYIKAPGNLFGFGRYEVTLQLPESGNLYAKANVTYRGSEVGTVEKVHLTDNGVAAVLSLRHGIDIPSDLDASVHSENPIGEQYVALSPRNGDSRPLKNGDVIPRTRASVGPDTTQLLDTITKGLHAIPRDNLKTVIDESYTAVGGLGPELARIVQGSTQLALDARKNLDPLIALIDNSGPVLDSQADTAGAINSWAAHLSTITNELRQHDQSLAGLLKSGQQAADQGRQLLDRLTPTLPILLANLVSINQVAITYQPALEELLVLIPQGVSAVQGMMVANTDTLQPYRGAYLDFNLNVNLPPVCSTGFLPPQQMRPPSFEDAPDRPAGDLYCRVPQDSSLNVRGARNDPCLTRPGKNAPTVKMCESDQNYVPLNDGWNWKGDPNATFSGQGVPQLPPGAQPAPGPTPSPTHATGPPPPLGVSHYDPANGSYVGPDGRVYTQSNLSPLTPKEHTWQSMLTPPASDQGTPTPDASAPTINPGK
jgi:phospholipid/cholesterol/gamma-HCH transport system substrate-binding protein